MASPGRRDGPCEARWPPSRYGRQRPGKPCIRLVQNPSAHVHSRRLESLTTITTDEFIQKEMKLLKKVGRSGSAGWAVRFIWIRLIAGFVRPDVVFPSRLLRARSALARVARGR